MDVGVSRVKHWQRFLVIALLLTIVGIALWDARRTEEAWLQRAGFVTVYFSNEDATALKAERRPLAPGEDPVLCTLQELLKGPENPNLGRTIPDGVRVLSTRLDGSTLYVDFSEELRTRHWGGSTGEIMTVYSIVNSLTAIPGVEEVVILLEGRLEETLVGHLILDEPIRRDVGLIDGE